MFNPYAYVDSYSYFTGCEMSLEQNPNNV